MDMTETSAFAKILDEARQVAGWTEAELDYHLSLGHDEAYAAVDTGCYLVANPGGGDMDADGLARGRELRDQVQDLVDARIAQAKARRYNGWSDAAQALGQRIRYADA
jgi:hypothetical protein